MEKAPENNDIKTAQAFASSWNNLPDGSVYTREQFEDWMAPLTPVDVEGKRVLELGCGNGSLLVHMASWKPSMVTGVDLGDSVFSAKANTAACGNVEITQGDLTVFSTKEKFDVVYCVGVLHHLKSPRIGFESVLDNTKDGGKFHCWVYAHEGNSLVRLIVEPLRHVTSKLPWWITKYFVATPVVIPFFFYAKLLQALPRLSFLQALPLYEYSMWIAKRNFAFFRHVAFDQLVTPQTVYIKKGTLEEWLNNPHVEKKSVYIVMRNGNSWKFGGTKKSVNE